MQNLTPYAAAKVTNIVLKAEGLENKVTPQMLYTYAKKGTIATVDGATKVTFDGNAFKAWLDKYVEGVKSGTAGSKVDYDALATQFM